MISGFLKPRAPLLNFSLRAFDFCLIVLSGLLVFWIKFSWHQIPSNFYGVAVLLAGMLGLLSFQLFGVYRPFRGSSWTRHFRSLVLAWLALTVTLSLLAFFTKTGANFSREWFFEWMLLSFSLSVVSRVGLITVLKMLRARGFNLRRIVLIGSKDLTGQIAERIQQQKSMGYEILAIWDQALPPSEDWLAKYSVNEIWITLSFAEWSSLKTLMHALRFSTANIRIIPDRFEFKMLNYSMGEIAGIPVMNLRASPMQGSNRMMKAIEDRTLSGIILILMSPLLLIIAIAVKLSSPGPVFYRQERTSLNNKVFNMLKFRSMPIDTESKAGAVWAKPGENRATKVGAFLRRTSLDELPQFINVLKGEMSIVGPRPERPVFIEQFKEQIPGYMQKHMVKAGITGWAQVNGWRGSTDLQKRIEYDLYYIEHWSLWFDFKIIFLTIFRGFVNKNAY